MGKKKPPLAPEDVERAMGYTFANRGLLASACRRESPEFAALEFYGDAYLNLSVCMSCWHAGQKPGVAFKRYGNDHLRHRFHMLFGARSGVEKEDFLETAIGALSFETSFEAIVGLSLRLVGGNLPMPPLADRHSDTFRDSDEYAKGRYLGEALIKCVAVDMLRIQHGVAGLSAKELNQELSRLLQGLNHRLAPGWMPHLGGSPPARRRLARAAAATLVECGWGPSRILLARELLVE
jgi:hypothetical protein